MRLSEGAWLALLVPLPLVTLDVGLSHGRAGNLPAHKACGRAAEGGVFLHVRLPWWHLNTGKGSRVGNILGEVCAHLRR